jgi:hypothetical protein
MRVTGEREDNTPPVPLRTNAPPSPWFERIEAYSGGVKVTRVRVWRLTMWLLAVIFSVNAFRLLGEHALPLFTLSIVVLAASVVVGSVLALLLVGFRRLTEDADEHPLHRPT